jgi:2-iminobutanoate/2-iminopropanoate deaminase
VPDPAVPDPTVPDPTGPDPTGPDPTGPDPTPTSRPVGPYTPVVRAGEWLVVSGQLGLVDGALVPGGVQEQLTQAIANLGGLLAAEGAALASVVKTTVFLASIADYAAMNDAYVAAFADHRPARSAVAVAGLPLGALVEIEAWAHVG